MRAYRTIGLNHAGGYGLRSISSIATELGLPRSTVSDIFFTGMEKLKRRMPFIKEGLLALASERKELLKAGSLECRPELIYYATNEQEDIW